VGGLSAMTGAGAAHPFDVIKVRMQIESGNMSVTQTALKVFRERSMFAGLSATLARQSVYSSVRFGVYDILKGGRDISLAEKVIYGLGAGGLGATMANPFDMTLVRMQADAKLPEQQRRNYSNVLHGVCRIGRTEGLKALWRGSSPTCARAMLNTASQFAVYDSVKEYITRKKMMNDGAPAHLASALAAGFVAAVAANPFDVVKTRIYNAAPGYYKGPMDCLAKTLTEGPLALYKGFIPTFLRQAPYVMVMFVVNEQLTKSLKNRRIMAEEAKGVKHVK